MGSQPYFSQFNQTAQPYPGQYNDPLSNIPTRNVQGLTSIQSPGQPVNNQSPINLQGFDKLGAGGTNSGPKLWERGGGKELLLNKALPKLLGKSMMTKGGGVAGKLAGKSGMLGKLGKGAGGAAGPWALAGTAAGVLGDLIGKKKKKTGGTLGGAGKGAATGAMIGSIIPGLGTALGGVVGGLIGGIKGFLGGKKKLKEERIAKGLDPKTGKPLPGGPPGLSAIGGQGGPSGTLGNVVESDPYGKLRAETEARYRPLNTSYTPFAPMPMVGGTQPLKVSSNPWDKGEDTGGWGG